MQKARQSAVSKDLRWLWSSDTLALLTPLSTLRRFRVRTGWCFCVRSAAFGFFSTRVGEASVIITQSHHHPPTHPPPGPSEQRPDPPTHPHLPRSPCMYVRNGHAKRSSETVIRNGHRTPVVTCRKAPPTPQRELRWDIVVTCRNTPPPTLLFGTVARNPGMRNYHVLRIIVTGRRKIITWGGG